MRLTKEQVEDNLKSYENGYWGGGVGIKELFKTALTLYAELAKLKAERDGLQMTIRSLKMRGES